MLSSLLLPIFHFMMSQMFSVCEGSGLQASSAPGLFTTKLYCCNTCSMQFTIVSLQYASNSLQKTCSLKLVYTLPNVKAANSRLPFGFV